MPVAREVRRADPTGVGDAFRAGFLTGLAAGLTTRRCAELGSMLATYVIETVGTQEYVLSKSHFLERLAEAYGAESADEIEPHIVCHRPCTPIRQPPTRNRPTTRPDHRRADPATPDELGLRARPGRPR